MQTISIAANGMIFDGFADGDRCDEAVLLLHGFPQTAWVWRHQLPALADAGYFAVALNQRGVADGARPSDSDDYRLRLLVSDVIAMIDALGFGSVHLVGHDWGGSIAWVAAALHGDRIKSVSVLSTPHPFAFLAAFADPNSDQRERARYMLDLQKADAASTLLADGARRLRALYATAGMVESDIETYVEAMSRPGRLHAALNWYRAVNYRDLGSTQLLITQPALFISGTDDLAFADEAIGKTADFCVGAYTQHVFTHGNHWLPESMASQVNRVLLRFLTQL